MKKNYQLKVVTTWNPAKKEVLNLFEGTGTDVISCDGDLWEVTFDENLEGYPLNYIKLKLFKYLNCIFNLRDFLYLSFTGAWLSLVERLDRDQEVVSSNLAAPASPSK